MAILVLCQRGNVRSVTVATILKDYGMIDDVIATGVETTTPETMAMLSEWADLILFAGQPHLMPTHHLEKTINLEIETDKWGQAMHPELATIALNALESKTQLINGQTRWPKDVYLGLIQAKYNEGKA